MAKITGVTSSGFEFTVDDKAFEDWRFLKAIKNSQKHDEESQLNGMVDMVEIILKDQEDALCEHLQQEDGTVSTDDIMREVDEIFRICKEKSDSLKN